MRAATIPGSPPADHRSYRLQPDRFLAYSTMSPADVTQHGASNMRGKDMASPRALVVDDNKDAAESFADLIVALGCEAEFITDPLLAIDKAEEFRPEIIFLDIGMPGLSGHDLVRMLRRRYGWRVRMVAVTGHSEAQDRVLSREAGFDAHVAKPVSAELVQSMLHTLFPQMRWR